MTPEALDDLWRQSALQYLAAVLKGAPPLTVLRRAMALMRADIARREINCR